MLKTIIKILRAGAVEGYVLKRKGDNRQATLKPIPPRDNREYTTVTGNGTETVSFSGLPSYGGTPTKQRLCRNSTRLGADKYQTQECEPGRQ